MVVKKLTTLLAILATAFTLAPVATAAQAPGDIVEALKHIPGLTVVSEKPAPAGFRFFHLTFTQPADHRDPRAGTFEQRYTLLHRDFAAPTVAYTSGYNMNEAASRSEVTQIVNGNQLSMEYRYFTPSRPAKPDWTKQLTIWQAAADEHRAVQAMKSIYPGKWLATGGSKGGMTATYFRRFFPHDVDGTIPYVAPNDVINEHDSYNRFLARVGNDPQCRAALKAVQRDVLTRRDEFGVLAAKEAAEKKYTFTTVGSIDIAIELTVIDSYWAFWQYQKQADCATVPAAGSPADVIYKWYDRVESLVTYSDQALEGYVPYYYQASVQLGSPESYDSYLQDLIRYPGKNVASTFVPKSIKMPPFDHFAMPDIDFWVRTQGDRLLYIYGENDPWGVERFRPSRHHDTAVYTVPGGNHGAKIAQLPAAQAAEATAMVRRWAGLPPVAGALTQSITPAGFPDFDMDPMTVQKPRL
ncbi:S28 family serine protease [Amycolatopsis sp. NPDC059657]|uniref:S28 family serine protease n=1 Tax=Amycolatopsis sp. NPDC059657 TaxID=3346899 RepID=UPI003672B932